MNAVDRDSIPDDLQRRFDTCKQELDAVVNDWLDKQHEIQPPSVLYHYTDGAGLLGILQSGKIRLSDIRGLNDPSELHHGLEIGGGALMDEAVKVGPPASTFAEQFWKNVQTIRAEAARFYVASLSRAGDDLGQWRAYGADGRGFALGFRGPELEIGFARERPSQNMTININYDENELREAAARLASIVGPLFGLPRGRKLGPIALRNWVVGMQSNYTEAMIQIALLHKHKAYKNEDEYRFLHIRAADAQRAGEQVRARGSSLVWYVEFDWKAQGNELLQKIVMGPALDQKEGREFVESCLALTGFAENSVKICPSEIPYRG